jgi:molybdopterin converting factor small subunit
MIRVVLPAHLRELARTQDEVSVDVKGTTTICSVLDALETQYPMLAGTLRDQGTGARRAFVRFFVCGQDWSHEDANCPLPPEVVSGQEPFLVVGAIAGG